jgi:hypothetical protein
METVCVAGSVRISIIVSERPGAFPSTYRWSVPSTSATAGLSGGA